MPFEVIEFKYLSSTPSKKKPIFIIGLFRTEGGTRTLTPYQQWILNPLHSFYD
ncbi:hypothetical protein SAMN06265377_1310 [Flagellimonas pacifica]|uniref:Uncharacterized protein n=1 Tax=Flagellimonas pacifica TaxID=1247520 RepID=A0A285MQQ5_9FLAO|nr:hypothetical protein SAMN06265377_1310 [Allomuricauda parva]